MYKVILQDKTNYDYWQQYFYSFNFNSKYQSFHFQLRTYFNYLVNKQTL